MGGRLAEVVGRRASESFVGRQRELAALLDVIKPGGPLVVHVHGIPGIGKTALLAAFCAMLRKLRRVHMIRLDCRAIEPTERGFLSALSSALAMRTAASLEAVAGRLRRLHDPVVLVLDTVEVMRLLEAWLRQAFIPALPDNARVVMAGREPASAAWMASTSWGGWFRPLALGPLNDTDALELLRRRNIDAATAAKINRVARGQPLALTLAAAAVIEDADIDLHRLALPRAIEALTHAYLSEARDALTREALEAAATIRRVTRPLLAAMLPSPAHRGSIERLRSLPFVERAADGLIVHEAVQRTVAASLHATDPERYRTFKRAAWQYLRGELAAAGPQDHWRCAADVLYLLENPDVREAFFPSSTPLPGLEPAQPSDGEAIGAIAREHEGAVGEEALRAWWNRLPSSFRVARARDGSVTGFYCVVEARRVGPMLLRHDPIVRRWRQCLDADPVPGNEYVLFLRRWLAKQQGERPSPEQAAAWLDVKRSYLELRPRLRRVYATVCDPAPYAAAIQRLGFTSVPRGTVRFDGRASYTVMLDMGPASVDGWLGGLISAELGAEPRVTLVPDTREVVVGSHRLAVSPREWAVLTELSQREGHVVDRAALLENVWRLHDESESNVLEVTVRSLRQKLREHAALIETVRGRGYRFRRI